MAAKAVNNKAEVLFYPVRIKSTFDHHGYAVNTRGCQTIGIVPGVIRFYRRLGISSDGNTTTLSFPVLPTAETPNR